MIASLLTGWATLAVPLAVFFALRVGLDLGLFPSTLAALSSASALILWLEKARPDRAVSRQPLVSWIRDVVSALVFGAALGMASVAALWAVCGAVRDALGIELALAAPVPVAVVLVLFFGDGVDYWRHRIEHRSNGLMWRIHAVHHWIRHFTGFRGARIHPLEGVVVYGSYGVVAGVLGVSLETALTAGVLALIIMSSQHVNSDVTLGPLRWVFVHTDAHRWHHDVAPEGGVVCNYANVFTFWDVVGGTLRQPHRFRGEYGMQPLLDDYPDPLWQQTLSVLAKRHRALEASVGARR
jgi:sterol desaturase/sphingolipid hydroxylase (fatty acid hydroxylase superfamily)